MNKSRMMGVFAFILGAVGLWAVMAFISALGKADWQVTQFIGQYLVSVGMIKKFHTSVDYYTHIKGIEYLMCVAFFAVFPVFYKYLHKAESRISVK